MSVTEWPPVGSAIQTTDCSFLLPWARNMPATFLGYRDGYSETVGWPSIELEMPDGKRMQFVEKCCITIHPPSPIHGAEI